MEKEWYYWMFYDRSPTAEDIKEFYELAQRAFRKKNLVGDIKLHVDRRLHKFDWQMLATTKGVGV